MRDKTGSPDLPQLYRDPRLRLAALCQTWARPGQEQRAADGRPAPDPASMIRALPWFPRPPAVRLRNQDD